MRTVLKLSICALMMGGAWARADTAKAEANDHEFVSKAAQGGMAEVKLGRLAMERGQSQVVRDFGKRMVADHSKANNELKRLAADKSYTLPTTLDSEDQALYERLSKLSGEEFDKAYIDAMVKDHDKDIAEFKKESTSGSDPDVRSWAGKTLPTLHNHGDLAKQDRNAM